MGDQAGRVIVDLFGQERERQLVQKSEKKAKKVQATKNIKQADLEKEEELAEKREESTLIKNRQRSLRKSKAKRQQGRAGTIKTGPGAAQTTGTLPQGSAQGANKLLLGL